MQPKLRVDYESLLRQKVEEVRRSMSARAISQAVSRDCPPGDEGDQSQRIHEEWIFLNRNHLYSKLLKELQDALVRVEDGRFGVCQACQEPISGKRLAAIPWAKYCVRCQEQAALVEEQQLEEARG